MAKRNLGLETNDVRVRHPRLAPSYKRTRSPRVVIKDFAMYRKFALCSLVCLFFFNFIWNEKINVVVLNLAEFFSAAPSTWGWSPQSYSGLLSHYMSITPRLYESNSKWRQMSCEVALLSSFVFCFIFSHNMDFSKFSDDNFDVKEWVNSALRICDDRTPIDVSLKDV